MRTLCLTLALSLFAGLASAQTKPKERPEAVPIDWKVIRSDFVKNEVLALKAWKGKRVRLTGYAHRIKESETLFISEEYTICKMAEGETDKLERNRRLTIEGTVKNVDPGNLERYLILDDVILAP